jgi:isoleucyl-tRNA synthetase
MVAHNEKIRWVPESIKYGRFGKWLEGARDWNISRNRYWGSAIPMWKSEDGETQLCVGSIKELYELNKDYNQIYVEGGKYFYTDTKQEVDLHKHFVDKVFLTDPKTGKKMTRIPEVLDCWFESGSMPYASVHYPFAFEDVIARSDSDVAIQNDFATNHSVLGQNRDPHASVSQGETRSG